MYINYQGLTEFNLLQYYAYLHNSIKSQEYLYEYNNGEHLVLKPRSIQIVTSFNSPPYISIDGYTKMLYGDGVVNSRITVKISYEDVYSLDSLQIKILDDDTKKLVIDNRKSFVSNYTPNMYKLANGEVEFSTFFGNRETVLHDERCMVDAESYNVVDNTSYMELLNDAGTRHENVPTIQELGTLTDDDFLIIESLLVLYSLKSKQWYIGDFSVLSEIAFKDDAFEQLILDTSKKRLLNAIVNGVNMTNTDFIDGKSGNGIILLHGEAGSGKTLTAESISEMTRKPLYKVSLGELGIDLDSLESNLSSILALCDRWGAILLIDEADVFLEERSSESLERNAMVAVFLRLLEYYNGVMFLTTNRAMNFDSAFISRITLAIEYTKPDSIRMWTSLLNHSDISISDDDIDKLSKYSLNGRQIKNCINSAKALAAFDNHDIVDVSHLMPFINETNKFNNFMGG